MTERRLDAVSWLDVGSDGDSFGGSRRERACTRRSLRLVSAFRAVYLKTHGEVAERLKAAVC